MMVANMKPRRDSGKLESVKGLFAVGDEASVVDKIAQ